MMLEGFGAIPIVDDTQRLIGIVSEHDLLTSLENNQQWNKVPAGDIMTPNPYSIGPDTNVATLVHVLQGNHLIRVPVGYELRSVDPIPYDLEYARDLGYCAAQFLLEQASGAMVCMKHGEFIPIPFSSMVAPVSGRTRVRSVDRESYAYTIARRYMVRLCEDDFDNDQMLAQYAATVGMTSAAFRERFNKSHEPTAARRGEHRLADGRTGIG